MKIILDNVAEHEMFENMLDVIVQTWSMDSVEALFISKLQKALRAAYIDMQGRENTAGLTNKDLLID
jgi:hypothetical protein